MGELVKPACLNTDAKQTTLPFCLLFCVFVTLDRLPVFDDELQGCGFVFLLLAEPHAGVFIQTLVSWLRLLQLQILVSKDLWSPLPNRVVPSDLSWF